MKAGILIGHLKNKNNEDALLRTAEAFGINLVCVIGKKREKFSASEGAWKHLIFLEFRDFDEFIGYARRNNHHLVSVENIKEAINIEEVNYPSNPIFITGHESVGVPEELLKNSSLIVKIQQAPTYVRCLNTTTACSIVIRDWFNKNIKRLI